MPYCKLYNIKSTKLSFQININRVLCFRFITPDKLQGIKFKNNLNNYIETKNLYNTPTINYWYKYSIDIDFSILNDYKYLVLQIYAIDEDDLIGIEQNNTFSITNENKWYICNDNDDTCGLNLYNQIITQYKPIQEIEECLKYTIYGSAKLIETKYLKSGYEDSNISITGFEDNVINYISEFKLDKIKVNNKINKNPLSVNKYIDLDKLIPTAESTNNEDFNSVNNKLEMIKLQLKNYFIENNSEIDKLEILVNQQESNTNINKTNIDTINYKLKDYNIIFEQSNTRLENITTELEKKITIEDNTSDISNINSKLDIFQINLNNQNNQPYISDVSDINSKLESFQKTIDSLPNKINIYANDTPYVISIHNTNWNSSFETETNKFEIEKFYMIKDEFKSVSIPYYCWFIKDLNTGVSIAKLFPVISITNIYF
jgi:hypothetical protein